MYKQRLKKASDVLLASLVAAAALAAAWIGLRGTASISQPTSAEVSSAEQETLPEDATVIVIDAGHGGFDGGAMGSKTGVQEADLNLKVSSLLADELLQRGYYIIMTREDENALAETKSEDMQVRRRIMQLEPVDLVVSVHMNKFTDGSVSGPMVFYMKNSESGKALAECVMSSICSATGRPQRIANPEELFVLRVPYAPSILVECGFLSNAADEALLCDENYQKLLAKAIAEGVDKYLTQTAVSPNG